MSDYVYSQPTSDEIRAMNAVYTCDMCGISLNATMRISGGGRSYCAECHAQAHQQNIHHEIPQSTGGQEAGSHRELIENSMGMEKVEYPNWGPASIPENDPIRDICEWKKAHGRKNPLSISNDTEDDSINDTEAYANKRLASIGGEGDMGEDKAAEEQIEYIPVDKCIDGHVYRIRARNGRIGVFDNKDNSFTLSRHKFGDNFLYPEYHWDNGEPYGTVKPLEDLGELPSMESDTMLLAYLNNLTKTVKGEEYPEFRDIRGKCSKAKRDD